MLFKVQGPDKSSLRATCRGLRLAVNACTSALTWTRPRTFATRRQTRALPVFLPASLSASCPGIKRLDCGGRLGDKPLLDVRLAALPPTFHALICSHTNIPRLGPLSAWTSLQTLDCSGAKVAELGPLASYHARHCRPSTAASLRWQGWDPWQRASCCRPLTAAKPMWQIWAPWQCAVYYRPLTAAPLG